MRFNYIEYNKEENTRWRANEAKGMSVKLYKQSLFMYLVLTLDDTVYFLKQYHNKYFISISLFVAMLQRFMGHSRDRSLEKTCTPCEEI